MGVVTSRAGRDCALTEKTDFQSRLVEPVSPAYGDSAPRETLNYFDQQSDGEGDGRFEPRRNRGQDADEKAPFGTVVLIEPRTFLRECIRRGMQACLRYRLRALASIDEFERDPQTGVTQVIILSCCAPEDLKKSDERGSLLRLSALAPNVPVVVLASRQDPELVRTSFDAGAKGYIPLSMGFDLAVEAVRFVLAGGSYVPAECLMRLTNADSDSRREASMTARELLVVRAIQQGKPNKVIAYELNMCESTVKVHVRHIMKKLGAKNRTAVAVKASELIEARAEFR